MDLESDTVPTEPPRFWNNFRWLLVTDVQMLHPPFVFEVLSDSPKSNGSWLGEGRILINSISVYFLLSRQAAHFKSFSREVTLFVPRNYESVASPGPS